MRLKNRTRKNDTVKKRSLVFTVYFDKLCTCTDGHLRTCTTVCVYLKMLVRYNCTRKRVQLAHEQLCTFMFIHTGSNEGGNIEKSHFIRKFDLNENIHNKGMLDILSIS